LEAEETQPEKVPEKVEQNYSKKRIGEGDVKLDRNRLAQAVLEERKRKARGGKEDDVRSSKKQKSVLESGSHEVTEEELGMGLLCSP
jgi:pre-mRNA-processing factor SLU7